MADSEIKTTITKLQTSALVLSEHLGTLKARVDGVPHGYTPLYWNILYSLRDAIVSLEEQIDLLERYQEDE